MTSQQQSRNLGLLIQDLSRERWRPFRKTKSAGREVDDTVAAGRYAWNVALCQALYPSLHLLEVALRNRMFAAGHAHFGPVNHNGVPCWLDARPAILKSRAVDEVNTAKLKLFAGLRRKYEGAWRSRITAGGLVAELSFGFWTYLIRSEYAASAVTPGILWPHLLRVAFPNLPKRIRRGDVQTRLDAIRVLRNRVFHHEPIWSDSQLAATHASVVDVCSWLSVPLYRNLIAFDSFTQINREVVTRYLQIHIGRLNRST